MGVSVSRIEHEVPGDDEHPSFVPTNRYRERRVERNMTSTI
jgi:hypothetical protein